jgi:hypothetical protein
MLDTQTLVWQNAGMHLHWTKEEARFFQLYSVGLHGHSYAKGEAGIRACFADLDTLQLDPLPILGRNHDLVIQARVNGTHPGQALDLIHQERLGFEYWDKELCAIPLRHYPMLRALMSAQENRYALWREERLQKNHPRAIESVYKAVKKHGPLSSRELAELGIAQEEDRAWKSTRAANGALEVLWNRGRVSVAQRVNFRRYFDLTERVIPQPYREGAIPIQELWPAWLRKRVRNVGLLPLRGDVEVWSGLRRARDEGLPEKLVKRDELALVAIAGVRTPFLAPADAEEMLSKAKAASFERRACFIAPLDPLIWCRKALAQLWDFEYAWEVYKPAKQRRWGYYVLPVLYGDKLVARFDGKFDRERKVLSVLAYHPEPGGLVHTHPAIQAAFERFLKYLGGDRIIFAKAGRKC